MRIATALAVEGSVSQGFEVVRDTFEENFTRRGELGGACCAYYRGEKVVDLWGGVRDKVTGEPWQRDTMVIVYSATKGLAAMTLAMAHSRGWLDYEAPVAAYWPEFAQHGKDRMTVRLLLAHQGGLFAIDEPVDRTVVADLDALAVVLARQKPRWEPGIHQAYHAITLGFYEGELLRRLEILAGFRPLRLMFDGMNPRSNLYRALIVNPGFAVALDARRVYARNLEVPSGGGVATARGVAHAYSAFLEAEGDLMLRQQTLDLLASPAVPPTRGFHDECLQIDVQFSLGFMKPSAAWPFGSPQSFGSPGSGGSLGFADPRSKVAYGYVTSQMGTRLTGDPRDLALRKALYSVILG